MRSDRRLRFGHKIKVQGVQAVGAVGQVTINTGPIVGPPPQPPDVGYNPLTDTLIKEDTMQSTNETATNYGASLQWHKLIYPKPGQITDIDGVVVGVDLNASLLPGYPHGVRIFLPDSKIAIANGTWPVGTGDYQGGMEGGMFMNPPTEMSDDAVGGQPGYRFWWSYRMKVSPGFRWSAFDPTTITPNTQRQFNYKQWLIFREAYGGVQGRVTFSTIPESGSEENGSSAAGDWPPWPAVNWDYGVGTDTAAGFGHTGAFRYSSTMNNQLHGVDKSPDAIADGNEHTFVFMSQNETVSGLGDGIIGVWVDNYPVIWCDGTDPTDVVYHYVFTRVRAYKTCQWQPIINGGAIQDQYYWMLGPVRAWTRPY